MTINKCITHWAMIFREPLEKNYGTEKSPNLQANPQLLSTKRWLDYNFVDNTQRLEKFCYYVEDHYRQTSVSPYPTNGHLTSLLLEFQKSSQPLSQEKYISFDECQKRFSEKHKVHKMPLPEHADIDISVIAKEAKSMSDLELLKKYGIVLCGELWSDGFHSRGNYKQG